MKKRILLGITLMTVTFTLTACSNASESTSPTASVESVDDTKENNADADAVKSNHEEDKQSLQETKKKENSAERDNEADKQLLKDAGWSVSTDFGLGLFAPVDYIYYEEDTMATDDNVEFLEYGTDDYDYNMIYDVYHRFHCDMYFAKDNMDFAIEEYMDKEGYDVQLVRETDDLYIYEALQYHVLFAFVKETNEYYRIRISDDAWEDFTHYDSDTGMDVEVKAGEIFTKERYNAFINTLQYLGEKEG
ncbi:MAG TPA: hypothetical protein DCE48_17680 [Lachnospiraceae bacterium]|uniref:hypothetical protein n=1 Tax=Anaerosporobacter sp. TaxID=1872529 RepID=UPI000EEBE83D|nr:hypothetical protein [Anaerosporobacter sp.]HAB62498.1 hypothetical protein [Lachnospiraceae bacterium]